MFARCPKCQTVHPLTAAQLSHAHGLVQCGQCGRTFSALNFLFDEWPAGHAYRPAKDASPGAPVLGTRAGKVDAGASDTEDTSPGEPEDRARHWPWVLLIAVLVVLSTTHAAWTFRDSLAGVPFVGDWLQDTGWLRSGSGEPLQNPGQLQLVSRDMHSHPTRSGILVLSVTFVNLAQHNQAYPVLEITLLDAVSRPVARRRLQPADYLREGADISAGLAPDVYLPVLLEFGDPGMRAVGFEIRFL